MNWRAPKRWPPLRPLWSDLAHAHGAHLDTWTTRVDGRTRSRDDVETDSSSVAGLDNDAANFDAIERHRAAVTRYIRYLIRDAAEAEDLTQEAFLRAHSRRETLRDAQALESWLFQIATHASIDRMRQRARAAEREVGKPAEDLPIADRSRPSALTVVQQSEMSACVQKYVAQLSDAYKAVLLMHDADGLTAVEIAQLLKLPLTTVKMRLHRGRRQLQAALKEACAIGGDERGVLVCEPKANSE